jgi:hypothetical protein
MFVCVCVYVKYQMARWTSQHEQHDCKLFYLTWPYRALLRSLLCSGRCIGPKTRAFLAAIIFVMRVAMYRTTSDCRT